MKGSYQIQLRLWKYRAPYLTNIWEPTKWLIFFFLLFWLKKNLLVEITPFIYPLKSVQRSIKVFSTRYGQTLSIRKRYNKNNFLSWVYSSCIASNGRCMYIHRFIFFLCRLYITILMSLRGQFMPYTFTCNVNWLNGKGL